MFVHNCGEERDLSWANQYFAVKGCVTKSPLYQGLFFFTREYMQCTAGYTFCFVVVVVGATFSQTWHYFSRQ
jgi:hypothetical protein